MNEENMTFEEAKLREDTYVLFNGVFLCGFLGLVFLLFLSLIVRPIESIASPALRFYVRTVLVPVLRSAVVLLPFLMYNKKQSRPLLGRKKSDTASPLTVCLGLASSFGLAFGGSLLVDIIRKGLNSLGYVVKVSALPIGENNASNIFYIIALSIIYATANTVICNMIAGDKLGRVNAPAAIIISAYLAAFLSVTPEHFIPLMLCGIVAGCVYQKTLCPRRTWLVWFAGLAVINAVKVHTLSTTVAIICAAAGVICFVVMVVCGKITRHEMLYAEEGQQLSCKDAFLGVMRSSIFWVFTLTVLAWAVFWYISKPDFVVEGTEEAAKFVLPYIGC